MFLDKHKLDGCFIENVSPVLNSSVVPSILTLIYNEGKNKKSSVPCNIAKGKLHQLLKDHSPAKIQNHSASNRHGNDTVLALILNSL